MDGTAITAVDGPPLGNAAMQGMLPPPEAATFISVTAMVSAFLVEANMPGLGLSQPPAVIFFYRMSCGVAKPLWTGLGKRLPMKKTAPHDRDAAFLKSHVTGFTCSAG